MADSPKVNKIPPKKLQPSNLLPRSDGSSADVVDGAGFVGVVGATVVLVLKKSRCYVLFFIFGTDRL